MTAKNGTLVFNIGLGLLPTINVTSGVSLIPPTTSSTFATVPIGNVFIKLLTINSLSLLGGNPEVKLASGTQNIFAALASVGAGDITNNYRVVTAGNAWVAGIYNTPLTFACPTLFVTLNNPVQQLNITVPAFLNVVSPIPAAVTLHINSLALFRTAGVSQSSTFNYNTSLPTLVSVNTTGNTFSFSTTYPYNQLPVNPNVNSVNASITSPSSAAITAVNLSSTVQPIVASTGLNVTNTNNTAVTSVLNIPANNLKTNFVQAGTYSVPTVYTIAKIASAYPTTFTTTPTMNSTLNVLVDDMSELIMQDATVPIVFNTTANYKNGVTKQMPNHLKASSTVPYDVTVKASSSVLTSAAGGQIPVGVITIEGMPSETGITPVVLSALPQKIISSANPVIDRLINLQYRIPATQTSNLVGKAAGTYTTTVTYTLVAP